MTKKTGKKIGRPTKRTPEIERVILEALSVGCSLANAARIAGIDADTLLLWRKKDPDFSVICEKTSGEAVQKLAGTLFNRAKNGDLTACIFWLKCRAPEFREPKEAPPDEAPMDPDPRFE